MTEQEKNILTLVKQTHLLMEEIRLMKEREIERDEMLEQILASSTYVSRIYQNTKKEKSPAKISRTEKIEGIKNKILRKSMN